MCATCGCSDGEEAVHAAVPSGHEHEHEHEHEHGHAHEHEHHHVHDHDQHEHGPHTHTHADAPARTIRLEQEVLAKNQLLAERNRGWFQAREVVALNLVSAPGSGKTTLLERTARELAGRVALQVIEGDQATAHDAERIRAAGCDALQINTGAGCHLDAAMVGKAIEQLRPPSGSLLMIENVGNLVCPALFDLGERAKVVIVAATEGEDKPLKYPHMFRASRLMLLNKIDLLPHLQFDVQRCIGYAREVNPQLEILQVSAQTGAGMQGWYQWLYRQLAPRHALAAASADATEAVGP
ncbi:MAG TPA: hydrogenase nickel incorporation protein HypB [Steroidobacteraceae bacterium]|jgi:hydrogenase nickel incorporation protein HypB|nr:hydrogenase nickel incorporation protein HypB [Steroidobacteraceae bacterium]